MVIIAYSKDKVLVITVTDAEIKMKNDEITIYSIGDKLNYDLTDLYQVQIYDNGHLILDKRINND